MNARKWVTVALVAAASVVLAGCADLTIVSLTHSPQNPTIKDKITFAADVKNIGTKRAGPSTLGFKVGGETFPVEYQVPALNPGETYTVRRDENLSVAQNYRNTVTADLKHQVPESNERNNQKTEDYTVRPR